METRLREGDSVLIDYEGRRAAGKVALASDNGRSLMLSFDAILGGYPGLMPVLKSPDDGQYRDLVLDHVVGLRPLESK